MVAVERLNQKDRKAPRKASAEPCPIERGMRVLGGKWTGSILWHLKDGPVRFNELARQLDGASKKMVNERLKELEHAKLVRRKVLSTKPIGVAYEITEFGCTALGILKKIKEWSESEGLHVLQGEQP
jgi:DNA-binding HxlR family transcriptional regulator